MHGIFAMIQPDKMHATLLGSLLKMSNHGKLPYFLPSSLESEGSGNQTIPGRVSLAIDSIYLPKVYTIYGLACEPVARYSWLDRKTV